MIKIVKLDGNERGKTYQFTNHTITLGSDPKNDLIIPDKMSDSFHGEIIKTTTGYSFRDLKSESGSIISSEGFSKRLLDLNSISEFPLQTHSVLSIGMTTMEISYQDSNIFESHEFINKEAVTKEAVPKEQTLLRRSAEEADKGWSDNLGSQWGTRISLLLQLSRQMNILSRLEEMLSMVTEVTFEAFPTANFFALSLCQEDGSLLPFTIRTRGEEVDTMAIISRKLLNQVVETRDAVLYCRGKNRSIDPSRSMLAAQVVSCMAAPLISEKSLLGVVQVDTRGHESASFTPNDLDFFCLMASHVGFAIKRVKWQQDMNRMFEGFVQASIKAIEARDPVTAGHSQRVANYACILAEKLGEPTGDCQFIKFSDNEMMELRYAALLHDVGKIGVPEQILKKTSRLSSLELENIQTRLSHIKEMIELRTLKKRLREISTRDERFNPAKLLSIQENISALSNQIDSIFSFVKNISGATPLSSRDLEKVLELAETTYTDNKGRKHPFLKPHELEHLTIRRGTLSETEWHEIYRHPLHSGEFLRQIPWSEDLALIPIYAELHHEKLDGTGYPYQLKSDEIPFAVKILTVADIFDALTASDRPYKSPASLMDAEKFITSEARNGKLDKDIVFTFVSQVIPILGTLGPNNRFHNTYQYPSPY